MCVWDREGEREKKREKERERDGGGDNIELTEIYCVQISKANKFV